MITNFKDKKLIEYLTNKPKKVLIRFGHGWGDTLMFMPVFYWLRKKYPDTQIDIYLECGQEDIFESHPDKEGKGYNYVFSLDFPMSEGTRLTKQHKCLIEEIGVDPENCYVDDFVNLPRYCSPFVAVHFQGTALPGSVNCPEKLAKQIWREIEEAGFIPIECHFEHIFHNSKNKKYSFINRDVRNINASLDKLIGLLQNSYAFIGVASGPLITALSIMPESTFYLENKHSIKTYTALDIKKANVSSYKLNTIKNWLNNLFE